jgi:DNA-binding transcriptional LysR family regulator
MGVSDGWVVNPEAVETFLAVVETRSFYKAAEVLYVSPSTVSHRVRVIERELGLTLLERGPGSRSVELTTAGDDFVPLALELSQMHRRLRELANSHSIVRISVADNVLAGPLGAVFAQFVEANPDVRLRLAVTKFHSDVLLREGRTDAVLTVAPAVEGGVSYPGILTQLLFVDEYVVAMAPGSEPVTRDGMIDPATLTSSEQTVVDWGVEWAAWAARYWPIENARVGLDAGRHVFTFLDRPGRWAVVPQSLVRSFAGAGFQVYRLLDPPSPRRLVWMWRKSSDPRRQSAVDRLRISLLAGVGELGLSSAEATAEATAEPATGAE